MTISSLMVFNNEIRAVNYSISKFLSVYPSGQVILARDEIEHSDYKTVFDFNFDSISGLDCISSIVKMQKRQVNLVELESEQVLKYLFCHLERLLKAAKVAKYEYLIYMEPDVLVRSVIKNSNSLDLDTLCVNKYDTKLILLIEKLFELKITHKGWGMCTGIIRRESIFIMHEWASKNVDKLKIICKQEHAMIFQDFSMPLLFQLAGLRVGDTGLIVEQNRTKYWRFSKRPLLHQYKKYYNLI